MTRRVLVLAAAAVLVAVVLWVASRMRGPTPAPVGTQPPGAPVATAAASATRAVPPTATPEPGATRHSRYVGAWDPEPTPSPTPEPTDTPTPRPEPSATPAVFECVTFRWSAEGSPANIAEVLVEIHARNGCGRDLEPLEVWFEATGYRNGEAVQSARGHPFDPLPKDGDGTVRIGLPGSADWYDEIRVVAVPGGDR